MTRPAPSKVVDPLLERVDHLVYSTTDVEESVARIEERLGVRATPGGRHPGRGTRNALIALSGWSYLEIVGPDPEQPAARVPRWFGIDTIVIPGLFTWAAKATELRALADKAARQGVHLGPVVTGHRTGSDGVGLRWEFTDPATVIGDGLVPFFIDWGDSPHPAASSPGGPALISLRGQHPEPSIIQRQLLTVGIDLTVERGRRPALLATLRTVRGEVELT